MQRNLPPESPAHTPIWSGAFGGAIGGAFGAALSPELALVGGLIGNGIGGSAGYVLAQRKWRQDKLDTPQLLQQKITGDFLASVLHEPVISTHAIRDSESRLAAILEPSKASQLQSDFGAKWLMARQRHLLSISGSELVPNEIRDTAWALTGRNISFSVSCAAINPAALSVLRSMTAGARHGIKLEVDYSDTCGPYQARSVADLRGTFDFVIAANAPFGIHSLSSKNLGDYRMLFVIFGNEQVLLRKKSFFKPKLKRVHVFNSSSAMEQKTVCPKDFQGLETCTYDYLQETSRIAKSMNSDEVIIAWEPLATNLQNQLGLVRFGHSYYNWNSLYCHKRWLSHKSKADLERFLTLFVFEWFYCHDRPEACATILAQDQSFLSRFAIGSNVDSLPILLVPSSI